MLEILIFYFSSVQHRRENGKMNSEDEIMESEDEFDEGKFFLFSYAHKGKGNIFHSMRFHRRIHTLGVKSAYPKGQLCNPSFEIR